MIEDIDYLGREWGKWMRYWPNGWYTENWIIQEEYRLTGNSYKSGITSSDNAAYSQAEIDRRVGRKYGHTTDGFKYASLRESEYSFGSLRNTPSGIKQQFRFFRSKILIKKLMPKDALRFHRAYYELEDIKQKEILWVYFVSEVGQERKLSLLKITQTEYARLLDLAFKAVARKIEDIEALDAQKQTLEAQMSEAASRRTSQEPITQLWPSRIFSYAHKAAINDSRRNPFPICLSLTGHNNPRSPFSEPDTNIYCKRENGELYAVVPVREWLRQRRKGDFDNYLTDLGESQGKLVRITQGTKPIRILRQTRKRQWLVGKEDDLTPIRILKALEHIAIAGHSPEQDALKAIWGIEKLRSSKDSASGPIYLDNDAYLPACRTQESFDQKAMHGFQTPEGVQILGIQSPEAKLEIKQKLAEFEEKISEAEGEGLTDLCTQHKKDMADVKRYTTGSCIGKEWSRPIDEGDIFRPILHILSERKTSALGVLRKAGLHDEADDLECCYKIENRTAIFFASRSRFTWVFSRD